MNGFYQMMVSLLHRRVLASCGPIYYFLVFVFVLPESVCPIQKVFCYTSELKIILCILLCQIQGIRIYMGITGPYKVEFCVW